MKELGVVYPGEREVDTSLEWWTLNIGGRGEGGGVYSSLFEEG